jgi:3-oxoacyl-[acyl-carrier-protein] synthase-3
LKDTEITPSTKKDMNVYITKAAKFLPGSPVGNDEMEDYLGLVDGKPSKARTLILSRNGIKSRYYALDREGNVTHTNVQMAAKAVQGLLDDHFTLDDIDVLSCGTATPEQVMPSHGVMVHG